MMLTDSATLRQEPSTSKPASVAVVQSNYIPWKGYFDIIHDVELFVFYDDVQYTIRDWRNRNRIKSANGTTWLTVPVGADRDRLICDVPITDHAWAGKHWKSISQAYARAPFFRRYKEFFEHVYLDLRWEMLSSLNHHLVRSIATDFLGIRTAFADSREYAASGAKLDRLVDIVRKTSAATYVSGPSAKSYIEPGRFEDAGIALVYKSYDGYPEYPQSHPPFEHAVSIIDLLFNVGPDAPYYIWGWREQQASPPASNDSGAR